MGYILPIAHYQYQDYQNRVAKKETDPYYIEKPYKVILDTKSRQLEDDEDTDNTFNNKSSNDNTPYKTLQTEKNPNGKLFSEITGKGQYFSESI